LSIFSQKRNRRKRNHFLKKESALAGSERYSSRRMSMLVTWDLNVALWVVLHVAVNVLNPPALVMLAGNALLLLLNLNAVAAVGTSNTPSWVFLILAQQILTVLQYGGIVLNGIFSFCGNWTRRCL
jgi:hypothetical protein